MGNSQQTTKKNGVPRTELKVRGMNCSNCVRHVTEAIENVPGVTNAMVTLEGEHASVRWARGAQQNVPAVLDSIKAAGYEASVMAEPAGMEPSEHRRASWQLNLWIGVIGTVPLMVGEWAFGLMGHPWFNWLSFGLATIVQFFAGARFYRGAWNQLKVGSSNMDTLVVLGSTTAYIYSLWAFFSSVGGHLYFLEAAGIITLISIGHWLEARVSARASSSLQKLMHLAPEVARILGPDGVERETPVATLQLNDEVILKPGDRIPTDGEVIEGQSAVDESMLTGESAPVDKAANGRLYAGTVNLNGRLIMRVTGLGEETALAHIIAAVQRAQTSRANIQRLGDQVSSVFVPFVLFIGAAAALWWGLDPELAHAAHKWATGLLGSWWPVHAPTGVAAGAVVVLASVFIVACPCAMGLATPAAIMAASNVAAQRGILIRDGVALEKAGRVTAVVFDKTGTLTTGKPGVAHCETWSVERRNWSAEPAREVVALASSIGRPSNHPLSQAVARMSTDEVTLADWQEVHGAGVQAAWHAEGRAIKVRLGSLKWLMSSGVDVSPENPFAKEWAEKGASILGFSADEELLGLFALRDEIKPGASRVMEQITGQGLKVFLVTGDNKRTAVSIAREAGIPAENVFAEVRPEKKAEFVKELQEKGERVAFIGDGINDAPALEQAELGIAVTRASDIAREAADMILLRSEIEAVPESLRLARATLRTIKQNLFWAFFYNSLAVPLAVLGVISPIICAAAMGFSDLVVIGNALRLRTFK